MRSCEPKGSHTRGQVIKFHDGWQKCLLTEDQGRISGLFPFFISYVERVRRAANKQFRHAVFVYVVSPHGIAGAVQIVLPVDYRDIYSLWSWRGKVDGRA